MSVVPLVPDPLPGAEDQTVRRRLGVTWASEIRPEPVTWVWEDGGFGRLAAGTLAIAAGREATGKSSFAIHLAAQVTQGELSGAWEDRPRSVLYVAVEDSWSHTLVPRLMAAGADLRRIGRLDPVTVDGDESTLMLPADNDLLEQLIIDEDVALVVIDPLTSAIGHNIDTHNERDTRKMLDPLARIATKTSALILGIAHFNKSSNTDPSSLITGSGAFKNVPRAILAFARSNDRTNQVMTQTKNSLGRDDLPSLAYELNPAGVEVDGVEFETVRFRFDGISSTTVPEILHENRSDPDAVDERKSAAQFIHDYLDDCGGEAPAAEVLEVGKDAGYNLQTLKNSRSKVATTDRTGFGKNQVKTWRLR